MHNAVFPTWTSLNPSGGGTFEGTYFENRKSLIWNRKLMKKPDIELHFPILPGIHPLIPPSNQIPVISIAFFLNFVQNPHFYDILENLLGKPFIKRIGRAHRHRRIFYDPERDRFRV